VDQVAVITLIIFVAGCIYTAGGLSQRVSKLERENEGFAKKLDDINDTLNRVAGALEVRIHEQRPRRT
jgi:hypothetical protein